MHLNSRDELNKVLVEGRQHMQRILRSLPKEQQKEIVIPDDFKDEIQLIKKNKDSLEVKKLNFLIGVNNSLGMAFTNFEERKSGLIDTKEVLIAQKEEDWMLGAEKLMHTQRNTWFVGDGLFARILRAIFAPQPKSAMYAEKLGLFKMDIKETYKDLRAGLATEDSEDEDEMVFDAKKYK